MRARAQRSAVVSPAVAPYGSWKSPITSNLITRQSIKLSEVRLDGNDIYWLEEPLPAEDVEAYARLRAAIDIPVAAGESLYTEARFRDVLLATPEIEDKLAQAKITPAQVERALDPSGYVGTADAFITAALNAHEAAPQPRK